MRWLGVVGIGGIVLWGTSRFRVADDDGRRFVPIETYLATRVPAALEHLRVEGPGFVRNGAGEIVGSARPVRLGEPRTLSATAPSSANAPFVVTAGAMRVDFTLAGSAPKIVHVEQGAAVYRDALPNVDVVAVHEPERFELLYVLGSDTAADDLRIRVGVPKGHRLQAEPTTGAALLVDADGRPQLRVAAPVAFDAAGARRQGTMRVSGDELLVAVATHGMRAPIVIDPAVTIPLWTIVADARGPGATTYDATKLSHETHVIFDAGRGQPLAVRPIRSQQFEDSVFLFGDAMRAAHEGSVQRVYPTLRSSTVSPGASEIAEWTRGYSLQSETWRWTGAAWSIAGTATLPGLIDPALAYDKGRGRTVLYGGAPPGLDCNFAFTTYQSWLPYHCWTQDAFDLTWEFDGVDWSAKRVAGSPPPRVRGSMAYDDALGAVVLFGGRALESGPGAKFLYPYGPPYPESFARGLLNDTWAFDGAQWRRIATGSPPPAREGAQLVFDPRRKVLVLIGGHTEADDPTRGDRLSIHELDGVDWTTRVAAGDGGLPLGLRTRRGAVAFWNAARQRITLFGGRVDRYDGCMMSDVEIAAAKAAATDDTARDALAATGCLGGYVHDFWEWDGATLTKAADAAFAGWSSDVPVFRQTTGASWSTLGSTPIDPAGTPTDGDRSTLLGYRYDPRKQHYALRTTLERAHEKTTAAAKTGSSFAVAKGSAPTGTPSFVSPMLAPELRPAVTYDETRSVATVFVPGSGAVYEVDGAGWTSKTSTTSPFAAGPNDFFAAAWDPSSQSMVLFDPTTGSTWTFSASGGWTALAAAGPTRWALDPRVRTERDLEPDRAAVQADYPLDVSSKLRTAALAAPRMTYDRARGHAVMIYAGALWELGSSAWTAHALPVGLTDCAAATLLEYDGKRNRVVAFGCSVPGRTYEWNGSEWSGSGDGPYQALVTRGKGDGSFQANPLDYLIEWQGTLQLAWAHPNAAFESPSLGGVSTLDADGTLRTWTGTSWTAGPKLPDGFYCWVSRPSGSEFYPQGGLRNVFTEYPFPYDIDQLSGRDFLPTCLFPPAFEDAAHGRIVALRDGPRGALEARLEGEPAAIKPWAPLLFGREDAGGTTLHPYPFELMSAEHAYLATLSDPATKAYDPRRAVPTAADERRVHNLWWPFRVFADPVAKRVRVLTNRGLLWELGGETLKGLGDGCESTSECAQGFCTAEKVCCDVADCGNALCTTCKGTSPGKCEVVAAGLPDPQGRCGSGECAGSCTGVAGAAVCSFDAYRACGPGPSCTNGVLTPGGHCAPNGATCVLAGAAPECPVVDGKPDLTAVTYGPSGPLPCAPSPHACGGRLQCADTVACKAKCTSRLDCETRFDDCDVATGTCAPDSVSRAAAERGVTPATYRPPRLWTTEEVVAAMVDAGVPRTDSGVFLLPSIGLAGAQPAFDPGKQTPIQGFRRCVDYVTVAMSASTSTSIDSVIASVPRCISRTPWLGDPAGDDCCPEACLRAYFDARNTMTPTEALTRFFDSGCYPAGDSSAASDTTEDGE